MVAAFVVALALLGTAVAIAAVLSPGGLGAATTLSPYEPVPEDRLGASFLTEVDTDKDGVGDALENYVYGTDSANWNSSGMGVPDGWLVAAGFDPLSPATRSARAAAPPASELPAAYGGEWPEAFRLPLVAYYALGKPADYAPGESEPWWTASRIPDAKDWKSPSGLPTAWLVYYGLDPFDAAIGNAPARGGESPLTVREAFEHNTNPLASDSDEDGLPDAREIALGTDPAAFSTSGTGLADGWADHYRLDPKDPDVAAADPDADGLTNLEEFVASYTRFEGDVRAQGIPFLFERGLDPLDWQTSGSGIPDGWYVAFRLDALDPAEADRELGRASAFPGVRDLAAAPAGEQPIPDLVMTVRDAYAYGRPSGWREESDGVWWGGTNPAESDSDADGLPDVIEIRGWFVNVTYDLGPAAASKWLKASGNPTDPDSDADGLTDKEEYDGRALCTPEDARAFPLTDPRAKDTAFSGLTDREKVCGVVRGAFTYDFGKNGAPGLSPTRRDTAGDYLRDGAKLEYWHERYVRYLTSTQYEFDLSKFEDVTEWAKSYARFSGMTSAEIVQQFRPDGDVDGDGFANVLDPDPSGGLIADPSDLAAVFLRQGLRIDPTLYAVSEFASAFPRSATDPANPDTDGDGLPDFWEVKFGNYSKAVGAYNLDPARFASLGDGVSDADRNDDGDVVKWAAYRRDPVTGERTRASATPYDFDNLEEFLYGTDPNKLASLNDGIPDGWKVFWGTVYPDYVEQGLAGDLSEDERSRVREGASQIKPTIDLKGKGNPLKAQAYVRFYNATSCTTLGVPATGETRLPPLRRESLSPDAATGRVPCPITTLDGSVNAIARVAGAFTLTYAREAQYGTNPFLLDTDGDGGLDAFEVCYMRGIEAPLDAEPDDIGCAGQALPQSATIPDPLAPESGVDHDGDGLDVGEECAEEPAIAQCSISGAREFPGASSPLLADTDLDGVEDGLEAAPGAGLDALNPGDVARFKSVADNDRDGKKDYEELTGWGKEIFGTKVKTSPTDPDSDTLGCVTDDPKRSARWHGDGLLDADYVTLSKTADAGLIADWRALGLAWEERGDGIRFIGEVSRTLPTAGDSSCDGIPDGWQRYYADVRTLPRDPGQADPESLANYEYLRPAWWNESDHGVWWWGQPGGRLREQWDKDLDNDGLAEADLADPFPALAANEYVHGAFRTRDPNAAAAYVLAATEPLEKRLRAQALGDSPGNPVAGRAAADAIARTRAVTEIIDLQVVSGASSAGTRFEVQKGREVVLTGRVVLNETSAGSFLNGEAQGERRGVPNVTVYGTALARDPTAPLGVALTDENGNFTLRANITPDHSIDAPRGAIVLGQYGGRVAWKLEARAVDVGTETRGAPNRLVVWSTTTPSSPDPAGPYGDYAWMTRSGALADAVLGAEAPPIPLLVSSGVRFAFDLADPLVNGGVVEGTIVVTDASGSALRDKNVTVRWEGAGSSTLVRGRAPDVAIRTNDRGEVNLTRVAIPVGTPVPGSFRLSVEYVPNPTQDPYLRGGVASALADVRSPVALSFRALDTSVVAGADVVVEGSLTALPYDVPGARRVPGGPVVGAPVRVTIGSLDLTLVTDAAGRVASRVTVPGDVTPGAARMRASYAGSELYASPAPVDVTLNVKRTTQILGLPELESPRGGTVTITGTLLDNRGTPLRDAPIDVSLGGLVATRATTNDRGGFAAKLQVPQQIVLGNADVIARFQGDREFASSENSTRVKVIAPTTIGVERSTAPVVRGRPFVLEGHLRDTSGAPVVAQAVELYWGGKNVGFAVTDARGAFRAFYDVPAAERLGAVEIGLLYSPLATSAYKPSTYGAEARVLQGVTLEVPAKEVRRGLAKIEGKLLDDRGNALPAQGLEVSWKGEKAGATRTARNGTFSLPFEVRATESVGNALVLVEFKPSLSSRFAPANQSAAYLVRAKSALRVDEVSDLVRGEGMTLKGELKEDSGRPIAARVKVFLASRLLGEATVAQSGRFEFRGTVPDDVERGATNLTVQFAGTRFIDPSRAELAAVVMIRPVITADVPSLALQGLAYSGEIVVKDDRGDPLRNQTFVYLVSGNPQPIEARTDADGRAEIAGVARARGSFLTVSIKSQGDVVPTEFTTSSVRVVGPTATPALGIALLVVLLVLAAAAAAAFYAFRRRRQIREVRDILDRAIEELLAGNEYVGTIFLAYKRLSAHVAQHGFVEKTDDTAREFANAVRRAVPVDAESLRVLIRLFEEAKYSDHAVGVTERDRAVEALSRVRSDLDQLLGAAKPAAKGVPA